jgi:hypothetical protein
LNDLSDKQDLNFVQKLVYIEKTRSSSVDVGVEFDEQIIILLQRLHSPSSSFVCGFLRFLRNPIHSTGLQMQLFLSKLSKNYN